MPPIYWIRFTFYMCIYPMALFPVLRAREGGDVVVNQLITRNCQGCYYEEKCICNGERGIWKSRIDCKLLECKHYQLRIVKVYCRDPRGGCMSEGFHWLGVYRNICVKKFCKVEDKKNAKLEMMYDSAQYHMLWET
ncbi:uncharacterized protein LOC128248169 isoform X2 [Octopus bimaculoides]|uniref:uncharacterized protein LOC128248169 isoform X2 n=1 Tax=Octopus bimaculoides TaxID=37653 RepID=UPI0022E2035B|nr:uncharacterized protein LOC128248169 isoform X2 [Octopus bimaculoides]